MVQQTDQWTTDGLTDQQMDQQTDIPFYRDAIVASKKRWGKVMGGIEKVTLETKICKVPRTCSPI